MKKSFFQRKRRRRRRSGRSSRFLKAFLVGAGLGAAAGLLTPPKPARMGASRPEADAESAKLSEDPVEGPEADPSSERRAAASKTSARRRVTAKVPSGGSKTRGRPKKEPAAESQEPPEK